MTVWAVLGLISPSLALAVAVWWYRRSAQQAEKTAALAKELMEKAEADRIQVQRAATEQEARHAAAIKNLTAWNDWQAQVIVDLARTAPGGARELLERVLRQHQGDPAASPPAGSVPLDAPAKPSA